MDFAFWLLDFGFHLEFVRRRGLEFGFHLDGGFYLDFGLWNLDFLTRPSCRILLIAPQDDPSKLLAASESRVPESYR